MTNEYYVYILSNQSMNVLYTGVTNDLKRRIHEHKNKLIDGFTKKYNVNRLVHYEVYSEIIEALGREKQIKGWARNKKNDLIKIGNPNWKDLYPDIL